MENEKELNAKFKAELNEKFDGLFRRIGNNRQQLANKVIAVRYALLKELGKDKIDAARQAAMLREFNDVERMASKQLPQGERTPVITHKPVAAAPVVAPARVAPKPESKPEPKAKPEAKVAKAKAPAKPAAKAKAPAKPTKKK